jgi:hypothetical protein
MQVLEALSRAFDLDNHENSTFAFTMPLSHVAGLETDELQTFKEKVKSIT